MFRNLFARRPPEQEFWGWFAPCAERYASFEFNGPEQAALLDELGRRLNRVRKGLQFEFGAEGGERQLVISADGNRELFPDVEKLVAAAPADLPGLRVVAFRRRKSMEGHTLQFGDIRLGQDDLYFSLLAEGDKVGVAMFPTTFPDVRSQEAVMACFLLLDFALGEYDVETKVGSITTYPLPPDWQDRRVRPFRDFAAEFDARWALIHAGGGETMG